MGVYLPVRPLSLPPDDLLLRRGMCRDLPLASGKEFARQIPKCSTAVASRRRESAILARLARRRYSSRTLSFLRPSSLPFAVLSFSRLLRGSPCLLR
jgi:hypothetical protein